MVFTIQDVAEHFNCSLASAAKISNILTKASDVSIVVKDIVDFNFCGVKYSLIRSRGEWILIRSTVTRSIDLEGVLR